MIKLPDLAGMSRLYKSHMLLLHKRNIPPYDQTKIRF